MTVVLSHPGPWRYGGFVEGWLTTATLEGFVQGGLTTEIVGWLTIPL